MRRTQLYLTEEQRRRLAARAQGAGSSEAQVVRTILDEALGISGSGGDEVATVRASAGLLRDAPDWPAWLKRVRGRSLDERLKELGL